MSAEEVIVSVPAGDLGASLNIPRRSHGLVIFAHGSGSSRFSPRNRFVAEQLGAVHFATLLTDLLTQEEDRRDRTTASFRFDIERLTSRLLAATDWAVRRFAETPVALGYFGASTGAAAALIAAARLGNAIGAVVSRGGRPDLAGEALPLVKSPTLLIVGENDRAVIGLNRQAQGVMGARAELAVVPGATHLFEEAGALKRVAELAGAWFGKYLANTRPAEGESS